MCQGWYEWLFCVCSFSVFAFIVITNDISENNNTCVFTLNIEVLQIKTDQKNNFNW